jgi:hypothetical protein
VGVHLQYPLADLLSQLPVTFHEEFRKLNQIKGAHIKISCEKHPSATQNEEAVWEMVATLVDIIAFRLLLPTARKNKPKEVKARIQELYGPRSKICKY